MSRHSPRIRRIIAIITAPGTADATSSTRDRLLAAAARVIARDGFQGARLADVAREAGLTTGAIYSNFRDKEELFLAAFDSIETEYAAQPRSMDELLDSYGTAIERFEASPQAQILNFELALLATRNAKVRADLRHAQRENIRRLAKILPGEDDTARRELAALLIALGNGLTLIRMFAPEAAPLELARRGLRRLAGLEGDDG